MLRNAARYDWHLHYGHLKPSVLGQAPVRNARNAVRPPTDDEEEVRPSQATIDSIRAYLDIGRDGKEPELPWKLTKIVQQWAADNAASGVAAYAHLPLPKAFARTLAQQVAESSDAEPGPTFDHVIANFDPSVRKLAAQQIASLMHENTTEGARVVDGPSWFGVRGDVRGFERDVVDREDVLSPLMRSRVGAPAREHTNSLWQTEESDERRDDPRQWQTMAYDERRDGDRHAVALSAPRSGAPESGLADRPVPPRRRRRRDQALPYDPEIEDVAKNLQFYSYDPAILSKKMPGWSPAVIFDDRVPEGYSDADIRSGKVRINKNGFGGFIARRDGTNDYAIMIKGAEVSAMRWNDVEAAQTAGADQVAEVAEDIYQQCKKGGVFAGIKKGGRLSVIGHSQGAPSAQLLGVYLIVRALQDGLLTEDEALAAIVVRGYGGMGARDYLGRLRGPDGRPLKVPPSVLEGIDAITYVLSDDLGVQEVPVPYVGDVYLVDTPPEGSYQPTEWWANLGISRARAHARSAYQAADYRKAKRDTRPRRGWLRAVPDRLGLSGAVDAVEGMLDDARRFVD